jgi:integrase/recombinase XerC
MGVTLSDLAAASSDSEPTRQCPTFEEYIPAVRGAVSEGTRRVYGSYWNRVLQQWADRRLDEITPTEFRQFAEHTRTHTPVRRNARGGRSATEHLLAALRCLYRHAEDDGYIDSTHNPARKVAEPRRLPSTRRAVSDTHLAEIQRAAAGRGNDPDLDSLLVRLHIETACRRAGALALRLGRVSQ